MYHQAQRIRLGGICDMNIGKYNQMPKESPAEKYRSRCRREKGKEWQIQVESFTLVFGTSQCRTNRLSHCNLQAASMGHSFSISTQTKGKKKSVKNVYISLPKLSLEVRNSEQFSFNIREHYIITMRFSWEKKLS